MNSIEQYKKKHNLTDEALAVQLGISVHYVRSIRYGRRGKSGLSPELAASISAATNGEISIADLLYPDGLPPDAKLGDCPCQNASQN